MGSVDIGGTLDHHGKVLKTHIKLCVAEPDFLKKYFCQNNGEKGPKTMFFEFIE